MCGQQALAEDYATPRDKSAYHLFNPTPRDQMRELSTDRPDKTESPYTVDAGHYQFETDLVAFIKDDSTDGTRTRTLTFNNINLKAGLTNSMDLQFIFATYSRQESRADGNTAVSSGFGDLTIRWKWNLIGNDEGDFAFGVMPYAVLPTAAAGLGISKLEGGLIAPAAIALPADTNLGLMLQYNRVQGEGGESFHNEYVGTVTVGHDIVGDLAGYVEFFGQSTTDPAGAWQSTFDFGLTYALTPDWQLDAGANIGLTESADDLNPFLGLSARF
jgi:hypothetical protein